MAAGHDYTRIKGDTGDILIILVEWFATFPFRGEVAFFSMRFTSLSYMSYFPFVRLNCNNVVLQSCIVEEGYQLVTGVGNKDEC